MTNIFIVDDHSLFRLGTITFLNTQTKNITVLGEAESGIQLFKQLKNMATLPDVLLLDIVMPQISGVDILMRMREEYPSIKVLMFSAETDSLTIYKLLDIGIDGFISKSAPYHELVSAILTVSEDMQYFGGDIANIIHNVSIAKGNLETLTEREREIMEYAANGLSVKEIAESLNITLRTVDTHKNNIFKKMGFKNSIEMVKFAIKYGIITL